MQSNPCPRESRAMGKFAALALSLLAAPLGLSAAEPAAGEPEAAAPVHWENWHAGNNVADVESLQRGARNFLNYCIGCHSLKYMRYQRMGDDLEIPTEELTANLVAPGSTNLDYILTSMPAAGSDGATLDRPVGGAVPAAAVSLRLGAEERVLERRALTLQSVRIDLTPGASVATEIGR